MVKRLLLFSLIIHFYSTQAQQLVIGIKSGLAINNVDCQDFTDKVNNYGICTGLTFDYINKSKLTLGADLLYFQRGFGNNYLFGDDIFTRAPGGTKAVYFNFNYLSLPIKLGYVFGKKWNGMANMALIPSFLLTGTHYTSNSDFIIYQTNVMNRIDFAYQVEMGIGYFVTKNVNVIMTGAYYKSMTTVSTQKYFNGSNILNYGVVISAGIKYRIKG